MNKWEYQKNANILAFLTAPEYEERKRVLTSVCRSLSAYKVQWGLALSANLFFNGLVDDFNDYDILVKLQDAQNLKGSMKRIGVEIDEQTVQKRFFTSPYYQEAYMGRVHFDLIGDITVNAFHRQYCYRVNSKQIEWLTLEGNVNVPLCPIETNMVLYGMMEGWQAKRRLKRELAREYLANGVKHPDVLEDALKQGIPPFLQKVVEALLL